MSLTNNVLNTLIKALKEYNIVELYNNKDIIEANTTTTIDNTIISYNREVPIIFCNICFINLFTTNTIEHLKKKHYSLYKDYSKKGYIDNIERDIASIEPYSFNTLLANLGVNRFYFTGLPIVFDGYKCRDCYYTSISYKQVRKHFNKEHFNIGEGSKTSKATYIIENVLLETIKGDIRNNKVYIIPRLPSKEIIERELNSIIRDSSPRVIIESNPRNPSRAIIDPNTKEDILTRYKEDLANEESNNSYISISNNSNLLTSFYKNSNILEFFRDKDKKILLELTNTPLLSSISIEDSLNYNNIDKLDLIEDLIINLALKTSDRIELLNRRLR